MTKPIEIRCTRKRHLLGEITRDGERYLFQPHEVLLHIRKSDSGGWYGTRGHARTTTGRPTYDLQVEADDKWQAWLECKCGRQSIPAVTILERVLAGETTIIT